MDSLFSWIQISDIHFGHGDPSQLWDQEFVVKVLADDVVKVLDKGYPRPDALFITGDVSFSGAVRKRPGVEASDEYALARNWLEDLCKRAAIRNDAVYIVPGNHDVQRDVAVSNRSLARLLDALRSGKEKLDTIWAYPEDGTLLRTRLANFLSFSANFGPKRDNPLFWTSRIPARQGLMVRVAALNTSLLSVGNDDQQKLELGNEQLVRALIKPPIESNELTILLTHHPFDWLRDEAGVSQMAQRLSHLHLCGHVHTPESVLRQSGGGTQLIRIVAGAGHDLSAPGSPPVRYGYNFGSIHKNGEGGLEVRIWPRRWAPNSSDFRLDVENVPDGEKWAQHKLLLRLQADPDAAKPQPQGLEPEHSTLDGSFTSDVRISDEILITVRSISDATERSRLLRNLAETFTETRSALAKALLVEAIRQTREAADDSTRVRELTLIATQLASLGEPERARAAFSSAGNSAARLSNEARVDATTRIGASLDAMERLAQEAIATQVPAPPPPPVHLNPLAAVAAAPAGRPAPAPATAPAAPQPTPSLKRVRIFVASPADVAAEREQVRKVIEELNRSFSAHFGLVLEFVGWESNLAPGMGRPQEIMNRQVSEYDIFVGLMWSRFGTPTGVAGSGTQEEFNNAFARWTQSGKPEIMMYFSRAPVPALQSLEAAEQLKRALEFRESVAERGIISVYAGPEAFADLFRPDLMQVIFRKFVTGPQLEDHPVELRLREGDARAPSREGVQQYILDLAREYDLIRDVMPPGNERTLKMQDVVTRMRTSASQAAPDLPQLVISRSAGQRLAAVVLLQIEPVCSYVQWLKKRFDPEVGATGGGKLREKPFLQYQTALALKSAASVLGQSCAHEIREAITYAMNQLAPLPSGTDRWRTLSSAMEQLDRTSPSLHDRTD